jgi:hypothetical protein
MKSQKIMFEIDSFLVDRVEVYILAGKYFENSEFKKHKILERGIKESENNRRNIFEGVFELPIECLNFFQPKALFNGTP